MIHRTARLMLVGDEAVLLVQIQNPELFGGGVLKRGAQIIEKRRPA